METDQSKEQKGIRKNGGVEVFVFDRNL